MVPMPTLSCWRSNWLYGSASRQAAGQRPSHSHSYSTDNGGESGGVDGTTLMAEHYHSAMQRLHELQLIAPTILFYVSSPRCIVLRPNFYAC
jgi:hypothetical protein